MTGWRLFFLSFFFNVSSSLFPLFFIPLRGPWPADASNNDQQDLMMSILSFLFERDTNFLHLFNFLHLYNLFFFLPPTRTTFFFRRPPLFPPFFMVDWTKGGHSGAGTCIIFDSFFFLILSRKVFLLSVRPSSSNRPSFFVFFSGWVVRALREFCCSYSSSQAIHMFRCPIPCLSREKVKHEHTRKGDLCDKQLKKSRKSPTHIRKKWHAPFCRPLLRSSLSPPKKGTDVNLDRDRDKEMGGGACEIVRKGENK